MNLTIYQVDAFTREVFHGNPAAVCPLTEWLPDNTMQRIAAENNLAETAFFVPRGDVYELRWFTPTTEVPLCGHATLASSFVIFHCLGVNADTINFISPHSGALSVTRQGDLLVLDFPAFPFAEIETPAGMSEALGRAPLKVWRAQKTWLMALFAHESDIAGMAPDLAAVNKLPGREIIVTAPGRESDFVVRMFGPAIGIPEDPVTGGIQCVLTPYWSEVLGKQKVHARQLSARGGELYCEMAGNRVKIGGHAALYLKGEIYI
jgi:PhzF family phenazine biosynthesis protein